MTTRDSALSFVYAFVMTRLPKDAFDTESSFVEEILRAVRQVPEAGRP